MCAKSKSGLKDAEIAHAAGQIVPSIGCPGASSFARQRHGGPRQLWRPPLGPPATALAAGEGAIVAACAWRAWPGGIALGLVRLSTQLSLRLG
jgi:hypothetical protein